MISSVIYACCLILFLTYEELDQTTSGFRLLALRFGFRLLTLHFAGLVSLYKRSITFRFAVGFSPLNISFAEGTCSSFKARLAQARHSSFARWGFCSWYRTCFALLSSDVRILVYLCFTEQLGGPRWSWTGPKTAIAFKTDFARRYRLASLDSDFGSRDWFQDFAL